MVQEISLTKLDLRGRRVRNAVSGERRIGGRRSDGTVGDLPRRTDCRLTDRAAPACLTRDGCCSQLLCNVAALNLYEAQCAGIMKRWDYETQRPGLYSVLGSVAWAHRMVGAMFFDGRVLLSACSRSDERAGLVLDVSAVEMSLRLKSVTRSRAVCFVSASRGSGVRTSCLRRSVAGSASRKAGDYSKPISGCAFESLPTLDAPPLGVTAA